jgi:hypothetical protein
VIERRSNGTRVGGGDAGDGLRRFALTSSPTVSATNVTVPFEAMLLPSTSAPVAPSTQNPESTAIFI